ncbi:DUF302 domain-containing protein [Paraburkholderia phenoliruptrix]|uniref:DUF302 domain-containing protein n=1 Tax=Paraburkholderia phenoliruptrix TaxID=252970 RepID=UPI00286530AC|nr:DUF302 domain-containing protein [Paraburkholderia phenoliruptrix]MDR6391432.1 uncharacterized protein (DUF302 family) [Paraburkholderia phenoliruptrix]
MANVLYTTQTIPIDHVTIRSLKPFEDVRARLEALAPRIDDGIFTLLRYGESTRALRELEACPPLTIFGQRDHGALLAIAGLTRRSIQYDIGNPLTASKMTRHQLSAGLYAPIRVLLREDGDDVVGFEYDRPASVFGQFGSEEVNAVAEQLDRDLRALLEAAAN